MISAIILFIFWYLVWISLSWPLAGHEALTGVAVSAFVTFMTLDLDGEEGPAGGRIKFFSIFARLAWFFLYVIVFLWECVRANIDVAFRVIPPAVAIRPGTLKIRTALKSDIALTFLANSITLTPGNTTVDVDKENGLIYVHCLYVRQNYSRASMKLGVVTRFEKIIKKIFE